MIVLIYMSMSDYEILGVTPQTNKYEIKKAYLKLMLKYHPDKAGPEFEDKCKTITNAYSNIMKKEFNEDAMIPSGFREMGFDKIPTAHEYVMAKMKLYNLFSIKDIINYYLFGSNSIQLYKGN